MQKPKTKKIKIKKKKKRRREEQQIKERVLGGWKYAMATG
jgi:hypothetical protein